MTPLITVLGDWGTTRLRLFRIEDGEIVARSEGLGVGELTVPAADALREALQPWNAPGSRMYVTLCGMAGSRNGVLEVPYVDAPAGPDEWAARAGRIDFGDFDLAIAAGVACRRTNGAADVMRGEETQIFGLLALDPALAEGRHIIGLPGTHGKWVTVQDGRIDHFHTYLTGELFALLRTHSTLMRAGTRDDGDAEGYAAGLARILDDRDLLGALFEARAAQLRNDRSRGWAGGFLSGLLIGAEVFHACKDAERVVLVGGDALTARYSDALAMLDVATERRDGDSCALAGLELLCRRMEGTS